MEQTVSQQFDTLYENAIKLLDAEDDDSKRTDLKINNCITELEKLTVTVSKLSMFSANETYQELSASTLKFLLLPYLLGSLWQIKKVETNTNARGGNEAVMFLRKNICDVSQIYFQDFIQRCLDYDVITSEPSVLKLVKTFKENDSQKDSGSGDTVKKQADIISQYFDSGERREMKVKIFKEKKELDQKIHKLEEKRMAGEELDDETVQELYLMLIRRAVHESSTQLEAIIQELNLIAFQAENAKGNITTDNKTEPPNENPYGLPFKTFILTKTDMQKNVFGLGYPSLPVMTVEELYQKRREDGTWPGPGENVTVPSQQEEEEKDEDEDNPDNLQRQRNMDEFKDTHRRGWGNRMNRS